MGATHDHNADILDLAGIEPEPGVSTADLKERSLDFIERTGGSDGLAAMAIGMSRWTLWRWKRDDPAFFERWKAARRVGIDQLTAEAERRAMHGSDRLLEFLLCNYAPERFSLKQKIEVEDRTVFDRLTRARARVNGATDGSDLGGDLDGSDLG